MGYAPPAKGGGIGNFPDAPRRLRQQHVGGGKRYNRCNGGKDYLPNGYASHPFDAMGATTWVRTMHRTFPSMHTIDGKATMGVNDILP